MLERTAFLSLERGVNDVVFAVSDSFGGWGPLARLDPEPGVRRVD